MFEKNKFNEHGSDCFNKNHKVVNILKKRAREMSRSCKVSRTFEFLRVFGAAEKSQGAAEKNKENVEANV